MRQHIDLYVNNFSIDLGEAGKNAVLKLMEVYNKEFSFGKDFETKDIFI